MRIKFGLNPFKYKKAKDENKETPIDKYVLDRERTNQFYLNTSWDDSVEKEIENFKQILDNKWKMWDEEVLKDRGFLEDEVEQELDNEEEFYRDLMEEIEFDPAYFTDDAPYDLEETPENVEKGIYVDSEDDEDEDDEDEK